MSRVEEALLHDRHGPNSAILLLLFSCRLIFEASLFVVDRCLHRNSNAFVVYSYLISLLPVYSFSCYCCSIDDGPCQHPAGHKGPWHCSSSSIREREAKECRFTVYSITFFFNFNQNWVVLWSGASVYHFLIEQSKAAGACVSISNGKTFLFCYLDGISIGAVFKERNREKKS